MIEEICGLPSALRPVTAVTVTRPVMSVPELVMKHFVPLITHSSVASSSRAVVRVRARVRAAVRLGQPERAQDLAGAQPRQPLALLLLRAEQVERHGAERDARLQGDGHRGVDAGQLLQGDAERQVVAAHAAVLLGEGQPEQAHAAHLAHDLVRELVPLVEVADLRGDDVVRELLDRAAEFLVLGGEPVVHAVMLRGAAPCGRGRGRYGTGWVGPGVRPSTRSWR